MNKLIKRLCLCFITILLSTVITACTSSSVPAVSSKSYFIATNANDNNPGTLEKPFASFSKAQEAASSGDTVYILGGTYKNFSITDSDTIYNYIKVMMVMIVLVQKVLIPSILVGP